MYNYQMVLNAVVSEKLNATVKREPILILGNTQELGTENKE
jgi:hypothetical protein